MKPPLSTTAIEFVKNMKLGFVATVRPDGRPNLSHKGTLTVFDDTHLIFADIASPQTITNLAHNRAVVVEVVDPYARRGFRFEGNGQVIPMNEKAKTYTSFYENWGMQEVSTRIRNFILIEIESYLEVHSPAYRWGSTEPELRSHWKTYYNNLWKF